jgi:hypothetical protein
MYMSLASPGDLDGVARGIDWFFTNLPQSLIVVALVPYILHRMVWPQRKCPRCNAVGASFGSASLARKCGRCKGSGLVKRII